MTKFDARKVKKLSPPDQYAELYHYWREAHQMMASNFPEARRYGRRLKAKIESLYSAWFGPNGHLMLSDTFQSGVWAPG